MKKQLVLCSISIALSLGPASGLEINQVEPTPLFPRPAAGQSLKQMARLHLDNPGEAVAAEARITVGTEVPVTQDLGMLAKGKPVITIWIPDIATPTPLTLAIWTKDGKLLATRKLDWQPQKKWTFYCASYSHQDLGFGDYPHRLRTSIRHENIKLPLRFCRETDNWPDDAKYRFNIETSEPITSFISFNGKEAARELARRMREGRIELGGLHNTANTEELSHELMARLFYMSGRYAVDLLGVPAGKTIQEDDVIGMTWPVATYAKEAGFDYCFHGFNRLTMPNVESGRWLSGMTELDSEVGKHVFCIGNEPNFYWQGPDGQQLLRRATTYERHDLLNNPYEKNPSDIQDPARVEMLVRAHEKIQWPFSAILSQDGGDFVLVRRTISNRALKWNAEYVWPHIRFATFDDYFREIESEIADKKIKLNTIAGDENNQWSDQDYAAARATGKARLLTESLPATETLASVTQVLAGGGDQWINLFQGYHRLLQYYEHTNAKDNARGNMCWYETELEENREMVDEAGDYQSRVFASASQRLAGAMTRTAAQNLIVFNALPYQRTDIVRAVIPAEFVPVDAMTGEKPPVQQLPDGSAVFVAADVPATGYKTYQLIQGPRAVVTGAATAMDSKFYRIQCSGTTGAITSIFDKTLGIELVEANAPHQANQYIYESDRNRSGMQKADTIAIEHGPVADVLTVTGKAAGVHSLRQTVILYQDLKRADFRIDMDKAPAAGKEAVFIALPFQVPGFAIHHELPGAVIEPYRQQLEGSATDHYAIRGFTDLSNDKYGVTVSPLESSLVCYGAPTTTPLYGNEYNFKRDRSYPVTSRLYLYLLDNMFDCNIAVDQRGPVSFGWSLRSHGGDWKAGGADRFGRSVQQPLLAWRADGKCQGPLPPSGGFMGVDASNVTCSVIKAAEANGCGFIIRLNETTGMETTATVSLPMVKLTSARATSLVENDRPEQYPINGNCFRITLPKFGVKTIRVTCAATPVTVAELNAQAVADMQVEMRWKCDGGNVSHFNIYRDTRPDCVPEQLNFIGQSATSSYTDRPHVNPGGWLRSCLNPKTTYYYRVMAVDRANNPGAPSNVACVTTPASEQANLPPVAVEGVHAILVSPISKDNFVNLLFRTACEPDVTRYEVHRSIQQCFVAGTNTLVGVVNSDDVPPRSGGYGESPIQYKNKEYDHATFSDKTVEPDTTYYYKILAVDGSGQKGPCSAEVSVRTKGSTFPRGWSVTAQSTYAPEYGAVLALDGDPDPFQSWISKPYGGGTKAKPLDVWWQLEFKDRPVTLKGLHITGDHRDVIPVQRNLQIQIIKDGTWKTIHEVKGEVTKDIAVVFAQPVTTDALRVFVPAADLPKSDNAAVDGIVRICEITLNTPNDK